MTVCARSDQLQLRIRLSLSLTGHHFILLMIWRLMKRELLTTKELPADTWKWSILLLGRWRMLPCAQNNSEMMMFIALQECIIFTSTALKSEKWLQLCKVREVNALCIANSYYIDSNCHKQGTIILYPIAAALFAATITYIHAIFSFLSDFNRLWQPLCIVQYTFFGGAKVQIKCLPHGNSKKETKP